MDGGQRETLTEFRNGDPPCGDRWGLFVNALRKGALSLSLVCFVLCCVVLRICCVFVMYSLSICCRFVVYLLLTCSHYLIAGALFAVGPPFRSKITRNY